MDLQTLVLRRVTFGENAGRFTGKVTYANERGEIALILDETLSERVMEALADALVEAASIAAANLRRSVERAAEVAKGA